MPLNVNSSIRTFIVYAIAAIAYFVVTDGYLGPYLSSGPWHEVLHVVADWTFIALTVLIMYRLFRRLAAQREQLRSLWRIAVEADLDRDAQVLAMLNEGAKALEMEYGSIGHVENEEFVFDFMDRRDNDHPEKRWPLSETLA